MANPYQKKDALKRDIELKGINTKRKNLFTPLSSILKNNLSSYLVKSELTSSSKNLCLETTFNTPGEGFIADVKAYVLDITDRQVVCQTPQDKDDTIIFSIIEEKAKSLTAPKKKSLNEFFETRYPEGFQGYKPKPTPTENEKEEKEIPQNLNPQNTEMTNNEMKKNPGRKASEPLTEEKMQSLELLRQEVKKALKDEGCKQGAKAGADYSTITINPVQQVIALQCITKETAKKIDAILTKRKFVHKPTTAKAIWILGAPKEEDVTETTSPAILNESSEEDDATLKSLSRIAEAYSNQKKEIKDLKAKNAVNEKHQLQMALLLYNFNTAMNNENIELWLRIKMDDGSEKNVPISREKFLLDYASIFFKDRARN